MSKIDDYEKDIITMLGRMLPTFKNKKDVIVVVDSNLGLGYSYSEWKYYWQRNNEVNKAIESLLLKNTTLPNITGVTAVEQLPDGEEVYDKLVKEFDKRDSIEKKKESQTVSFCQPVICIANMADQHMGDTGSDIKRLFYETDIIIEQPNFYINCLGDVSNMFIQQWTHSINIGNPITIEEEISIAKMWINKVSDKLINTTAGNHDLFGSKMGYNVLKQTLSDNNSKSLYDDYDSIFTVDVNGYQNIFRCRHKWRGTSATNIFHGIIKARLYDHVAFDVGIGAHLHPGACYAAFPLQGKLVHTAMCGAYKKYDNYKKEKGFSNSTDGTVVYTIIDSEQEEILHTTSLKQAIKITQYLNNYYT